MKKILLLFLLLNNILTMEEIKELKKIEEVEESKESEYNNNVLDLKNGIFCYDNLKIKQDYNYEDENLKLCSRERNKELIEKIIKDFDIIDLNIIDKFNNDFSIFNIFKTLLILETTMEEIVFVEVNNGNKYKLCEFFRQIRKVFRDILNNKVAKNLFIVSTDKKVNDLKIINPFTFRPIHPYHIFLDNGMIRYFLNTSDKEVMVDSNSLVIAAIDEKETLHIGFFIENFNIDLINYIIKLVALSCYYNNNLSFKKIKLNKLVSIIVDPLINFQANSLSKENIENLFKKTIDKFLWEEDSNEINNFGKILSPVKEDEQGCYIVEKNNEQVFSTEIAPLLKHMQYNYLMSSKLYEKCYNNGDFQECLFELLGKKSIENYPDEKDLQLYNKNKFQYFFREEIIKNFIDNLLLEYKVKKDSLIISSPLNRFQVLNDIINENRISLEDQIRRLISYKRNLLKIKNKNSFTTIKYDIEKEDDFKERRKFYIDIEDLYEKIQILNIKLSRYNNTIFDILYKKINYGEEKLSEIIECKKKYSQDNYENNLISNKIKISIEEQLKVLYKLRTDYKESTDNFERRKYIEKIRYIE
jgi:hypothetical protein